MKKKNVKFFIRTFGCAANEADSQRIAAKLIKRGYKQAKNIKSADLVVINSCIVRQSAENRVYGLIRNLMRGSPTVKVMAGPAASSSRPTASQVPDGTWSRRSTGLPPLSAPTLKVLLTGCLAGWALKDKTGKNLENLKKKIKRNVQNVSDVEIVLTEELAGFDISPLRDFEKLDKKIALVPISWGCSQFCSYCIVPYARGLVKHRKAEEILKEVKKAVVKGRTNIVLLGENVNVWRNKLKTQMLNVKTKSKISNLKRDIKIADFPQLLAGVAEIKGVELVEFMSPNPWDFPNELIDVIAKYPNISKTIHLPLQSGDDEILKKMNRPYTAKKFLDLALKLKAKSPASPAGRCKLSTDLIVGFPGETEKAFQNTVKLCKKVGFVKAYIARYSPRPTTVSVKLYKDDVSACEKKRRWQILEKLING